MAGGGRFMLPATGGLIEIEKRRAAAFAERRLIQYHAVLCKDERVTARPSAFALCRYFCFLGHFSCPPGSARFGEGCCRTVGADRDPGGFGSSGTLFRGFRG